MDLNKKKKMFFYLVPKVTNETKAMASEIAKICLIPSEIDLVIVDKIMRLFFGPNGLFVGSPYTLWDSHLRDLVKTGEIVNERPSSFIQFDITRCRSDDVFVTYYSYVDSRDLEELFREIDYIVGFEKDVNPNMCFAFDIHVMAFDGNLGLQLRELKTKKNVKVHLVIEEDAANHIIEEGRLSIERRKRWEEERKEEEKRIEEWRKKLDKEREERIAEYKKKVEEEKESRAEFFEGKK